MNKSLLQELAGTVLAGITATSAINQKINKTEEVDIFPKVNENTGVDPINQIADLVERLLDSMPDLDNRDDYHDATSNILTALHEELRDRGRMG